MKEAPTSKLDLEAVSHPPFALQPRELFCAPSKPPLQQKDEWILRKHQGFSDGWKPGDLSAKLFFSLIKKNLSSRTLAGEEVIKSFSFGTWSGSLKFKSDGKKDNLFSEVVRLSARITTSFSCSCKLSVFQSSNKERPYFSYELTLHHSSVPLRGQQPHSLVLLSMGACGDPALRLLWGYLHELTHKHEDESQMARLVLEIQCRSDQVLDASHHAYFAPCLTAEPAVQML